MSAIIPPDAEWKDRVRREIRGELRARHSLEARRGGIWNRLRDWLRLEAEVAREMKRRFPPGALHAKPEAGESRI